MGPNLSARSAATLIRNREAATRMGHHLEAIFPQRITDDQRGIPQEYVDDIADAQTRSCPKASTKSSKRS